MISVRVPDCRAGVVGDVEADALDRGGRTLYILLNHEDRQRLIVEVDGLGVIGIDHHRLRGRVELVALRGLCLGHDIRGGSIRQGRSLRR